MQQPGHKLHNYLATGKDPVCHHEKEFVLISLLQVSSLFCAIAPHWFASKAGPDLELCFLFWEQK